MHCKNIIFFIVFSVFASMLCHAQYSISEGFYKAVEDTLKPKDRTHIDAMSLLRFIDHNSLAHPEFNDEKDSLIELIKKETKTFNLPDRTDAYFMLMLYNFNHNHQDSVQTNKYGDSLKTLIAQSPTGHDYKLFIYGAMEAIHQTDANRYGKAIDKLNEVINKYPEIEDPAYMPSIYQTLAHAYFQTQQFDEALATYKKVDSIATLYSTDQHQKHLKKYIRDVQIEIDIISYMKSKDAHFLQDAERKLDKVTIDTTKHNDPWVSLYFIRKTYVSFLKNDLAEAERLYKKIKKETVLNNDYILSPRMYYILNDYIIAKKGHLEEAEKHIDTTETDDPTENFYKMYLYEILYNAYKNRGDYAQAIDVLESLHKSQASLHIFNYQGAMAVANKKYNLLKKEDEIKALKNEVKLKKNRNLLFFLSTLFILLLSAGIVLLKSKQNEIKRLINEEVYNSRIRLLEESLEETDRKLMDNRKEIGQKIHNEFLSNILALKYMVTDFIKNAASKASKQKLESIADELDTLYNESRNFSHNLISGGETDKIALDVMDYLSELQDRFAEVGLLKIETQISEDAKLFLQGPLTKEQQQAVYQLIKESITNTIKHANAGKICIKMCTEQNTFKIQLLDNGTKAIKPNRGKANKGVGLSSLESKIDRLGGKITFRNEKKGFKVKAIFPIQSKSA